ncbi:hypothetical protein BST92_03775 [Nonlabens arenilitoris]|uniref:HTH cro/C1-type domain-containing protein n=1 Tax=Nonlabens arenilitoris TaxID=1217969 RepID=A0A2S7U807_9FLAO|nr:helix-turn-helix transcriptional regulator [Nonlabens arenilitoris]PQJ31096.1 hypothetical protein BST92_03775 [Nonlabens arenilitoris]
MNIFISHNISYLIRKEKWDHATFAKEFGLSAAVVSHYVRGKNIPKIETLVKIAFYFTITLDELILSDMEAGMFPASYHMEALHLRDINDKVNSPNKNDTIKHLEKTIELQDKLIHSYEIQIQDLTKKGGDESLKIEL